MTGDVLLGTHMHSTMHRIFATFTVLKLARRAPATPLEEKDVHEVRAHTAELSLAHPGATGSEVKMKRSRKHRALVLHVIPSCVNFFSRSGLYVRISHASHTSI